MNQSLTYVDGETLMSTVLPPIRFVISQLLPQGLHILAGAPKLGKSWLSLWLCLQVAKGEPAWIFNTVQGDVLYLCLEDSYSRIQNRLLDVTDDAPPNLFFATVSEKLHSGLEQQIERFLAAHPGTVLIVIDTLQRIRSGANDANPYASDYRDLGILKELADKHRIAILLIHHLWPKSIGNDGLWRLYSLLLHYISENTVKGIDFSAVKDYDIFVSIFFGVHWKVLPDTSRPQSTRMEEADFMSPSQLEYFLRAAATDHLTQVAAKLRFPQTIHRLGREVGCFHPSRMLEPSL